MNSLTCGVRNKMGIAHGHGQGFMAHQGLYSININAGQSQPTGEGMAQSMKHHSLLPVVFSHSLG